MNTAYATPISGYMGNPSYNLQTTLQHSALRYIQTEDPLMNAILTFFVLSLLSNLIPKIERLPGWIIVQVCNIYHVFRYIGRFLWVTILCRRDIKKYEKKIIIEKITDERQLNPLYNAVAWYLMNQVNLDEEDIIKVMIDEKINDKTEKVPKMLRRITSDLNRDMTFEGRKICYRMSANSINMDSDGSNTISRRNDTITCWIDTDRKEDTFLEHFVQVCMDQYHGHAVTKVTKRHIYQNMNGEWKTVCEQQERMDDTIVLRGNDKETLMREIEHFINNKEWYISHGFLYSLGVMLCGHPGTGKTSLIRYISTKTRRNTHYLRLSQIASEDEFNRLLQNVDLSKTVLVMEDIDCAGKMVHNREKIYTDEHKDDSSSDSDDSQHNRHRRRKKREQTINIVVPGKDNNQINRDMLEKKDKVTLDILLNILDGILTTPGQIVIMTTNFKDVLDKALIRPGRIDINLELSKCTHEMIRKLLQRFYNVETIPQNIMDMIHQIPSEKHSPAYVMNVFRKYKIDMEGAMEQLVGDTKDEFQVMNSFLKPSHAHSMPVVGNSQINLNVKQLKENIKDKFHGIDTFNGDTSQLFLNSKQ